MRGQEYKGVTMNNKEQKLSNHSINTFTWIRESILHILKELNKPYDYKFTIHELKTLK